MSLNEISTALGVASPGRMMGSTFSYTHTTSPLISSRPMVSPSSGRPVVSTTRVGRSRKGISLPSSRSERRISVRWLAPTGDWSPARRMRRALGLHARMVPSAACTRMPSVRLSTARR